MSSSPKRQRTEDAPITCSEIWYQDGSVVLQAQDTQFRVHFGVLSQQSTFFREMQGLLQPPDQPTVEGCPVVEMQDDVSDVMHLLTAVYDPTFLGQKAIPLPYIASLIKLGRKYDFRKLLDAAVERLEFENPTTLSEYEARLTKNTRQYSPTRILYSPGILFDMLTVARENNILTALPCAYYRALAAHSRTELFDGIPRGDGTVATLAQVDQRQCVLSRDKLFTAQFQEGYTLGWVSTWEFAEDCDDRDRCTHEETRISLMPAMVQKLKVSIFWDLRNAYSKCCASCRKHTAELTQRGRKKAWDELPSFFDGLPPWNELKNDL